MHFPCFCESIMVSFPNTSDVFLDRWFKNVIIIYDYLWIKKNKISEKFC